MILDKSNMIKDIVCQEVGRKVFPELTALWKNYEKAARALLSSNKNVGIISGFYIPSGNPPAAETDGPVGLAHLLKGLTAAGFKCNVATDDKCSSVIGSAIKAAGHTKELEIVSSEKDVIDLKQKWDVEKVSCLIAIERCGVASDGRYYNAAGKDISQYTAPFDLLFHSKWWYTIAIGDGGNEIGMGSVPTHLLSRVNFITQIKCVTPADAICPAAVSNWGALGLLASMALLDKENKVALTNSFSIEFDQSVLHKIVDEGGAIDGMTKKREYTVDGLPHQKNEEIIPKFQQALE